MLFWLVLPLAAASGWYVARRDGVRTSKARVYRLSSDYFRGLNYLLNEQPDQALETFLSIQDSDSDTFETQLALGSLFRRRGEVDRAVRVHQSLLGRPGLDQAQRQQAELELAEDYYRAGLLDRAEDAFTAIARRTGSARAWRRLVNLFQAEHDYDKAIEAAHALAAEPEYRHLEAQLWCEMADKSLRDGHRDAAQGAVDQAVAADPQCVRAHMLAAQLAIAGGDLAAAIAALEHAVSADPAFIPELVPVLERECRSRGELELLATTLDAWYARAPRTSILLAQTRLVAERSDQAQALAFLREQIRRRPTVMGLKALIAIAEPTAVVADLGMLRELADRVLEGQARYRCRRCGFGSRQLNWQCPSCKTWGSVKPVEGVTGE